MERMPYPGVGICVIVWNDEGKMLMGKRKNSHGAGQWSWPGGKQDFGESWKETALREGREEADLEFDGPLQFVYATDNYFPEWGKHFTTIILEGRIKKGCVPKTMEPDKCEGWEWIDPSELPDPLFDPIARCLADNLVIEPPADSDLR